MMCSKASVVGFLLTCMCLFAEALDPLSPIFDGSCRPIICTPPDPDHCPSGYGTDENGCPTCNCIKPVECPACKCSESKPVCPSICCPTCSTGHHIEKDTNGCVSSCTCDLPSSTATPRCSVLQCLQCRGAKAGDPSCADCNCEIIIKPGI